MRRTLELLHSYRRALPGSQRVLVGDFSRRRGGFFRGHSTHQNGRDVDIYYPRQDRKLVEPHRVSQVDRRLAQALVDRAVRLGASLVLVGPNLGLSGPSGVVIPYPHHDDHLHVRWPVSP